MMWPLPHYFGNTNVYQLSENYRQAKIVLVRGLIFEGNDIEICLGID